MNYRKMTLLAAVLLSFAVVPRGFAVPSDAPFTEPPPPAPSQSTSPNKPTTPTSTDKDKKKPTNTNTNTNQQKGSHNRFLEGYKAAYRLIYKGRDYERGIARLKALGHDDHPDVANLIGYSSRKLGRYDDARHWYEKALTADPNHARTWSYYGMWHAEQGNILKARDHLAKVQSICGTTCREYVELKGVMDGTRLY